MRLTPITFTLIQHLRSYDEFSAPQVCGADMRAGSAAVPAISTLKARVVQRVRPIADLVYYPLLVTRTQKRERDLQAINDLVRPGDVVADIGANIGVYSVALSRIVGPTGQVYSFEPAKVSYRRLNWTLRALRARNVVTHKVALSDKAGEAELAIPDQGSSPNWYRASLELDSNSAGNRVESVKVERLDDVLSVQPTFIKVDVEGHEYACLRGATRILESRPTLLVELDGHQAIDRDVSNSPTHQLLSSLGYTCKWFDGSSFVEHTKETPNPSVNYWFFPKLSPAGGSY